MDAAVALGVDAIGFVFYPRSPRLLTFDEAASLRRRLPSWVSAVGLFVNADAAHIMQASRNVGLDVIQFHGDETPQQCAASAPGTAWWRAVRMRSERDLIESFDAFPHAEALLVDSFHSGYGGSGQSFDWSWVPSSRPRPLILSGGLDAASVGQAIARVAPFAVDVSSGIQAGDARMKDTSKMEAFVAAVIKADAARSHSNQTSQNHP